MKEQDRDYIQTRLQRLVNEQFQLTQELYVLQKFVGCLPVEKDKKV